MKTLLLTIVTLLVMLASSATADGPRVGAKGRYIGGDVVALALTNEQKEFLNKERLTAVESAMELTLQQSKKVKKGLGIETSLLEVWDTRQGGADCSCLSANIALRFSDDLIEVLKPYLLTDEKALAKWKSVDAID